MAEPSKEIPADDAPLQPEAEFEGADPALQPFWSLGQTLAWIMWRTPSLLRRASWWFLSASDDGELEEIGLGAPQKTGFEEATRGLRQRLQDQRLVATGTKRFQVRNEIPHGQWQDLRIGWDGRLREYWYSPNVQSESEYFYDVTVPAAVVQQIWTTDPVKQTTAVDQISIDDLQAWYLVRIKSFYGKLPPDKDRCYGAHVSHFGARALPYRNFVALRQSSSHDLVPRQWRKSGQRSENWQSKLTPEWREKLECETGQKKKSKRPVPL